MLLGRTNASYPRVWASLAVSSETSPGDLAVAARDLGVPMDISSQPALWGGFLRGGTDVLVQRSTSQYERATSQDHATDLIQAHLIEVLSAVGREMVDFYFLRVRRVVEEFQINGALAALEFAKQEGHIRHLGLFAEGPALAVQSLWQFHDAFEVVLLPDEQSSLRTMASERRVGVVSLLARDADLPGGEETCLATVSTQAQVSALGEFLGAPA
ncbi:MAG: hypothetical protein JST12_16255 [Armatimonadetes bacterium]|nr:hypothetical protein [Armatimonadota bacterium]